MPQFFKTKCNAGKEYILNMDYVVGITPIDGEKSFLNGGVIMVRGAAKGANFSFTVNKSELKKVVQVLMPK